jgi:hypothetical protein
MQADPLNADRAKRNRCRFQFQIRTLMLLMALVGLAMATLITPIKKRVEKQRAAVAAILSNGGSVVYDFEQDGQKLGIRNPVPPGPRWLRLLLGNNYGANVVEIQLYSGAGGGIGGDPVRLMTPDKFTDREAELLAACTGLRLLVLADTKITDAGIKHFRDMSELECLNLEGTLVTKPAVLELHSALPNARIIFGNDDVLGPPRNRATSHTQFAPRRG